MASVGSRLIRMGPPPPDIMTRGCSLGFGMPPPKIGLAEWSKWITENASSSLCPQRGALDTCWWPPPCPTNHLASRRCHLPPHCFFFAPVGATLSRRPALFGPERPSLCCGFALVHCSTCRCRNCSSDDPPLHCSSDGPSLLQFWFPYNAFSSCPGGCEVR